MWSLNLGPLALDASTLPLGYRGDGFYIYDKTYSNKLNESVNNINTALIYDKCLNAKIKKINLW